MKNLEGKKAPAFCLDGSDGKKHSLEDYRGKTVVLYFYPKDNTTVVIGPKGDVIKHWPTVKKAEEHPDEVVEYLKSL